MEKFNLFIKQNNNMATTRKNFVKITNDFIYIRDAKKILVKKIKNKLIKYNYVAIYIGDDKDKIYLKPTKFSLIGYTIQRKFYIKCKALISNMPLPIGEFPYEFYDDGIIIYLKGGEIKDEK
jgi:hypothetical protein